MNIALFFTYDVSLKDWQELGLLDRELELYNSITKDNNIKFTFVTYGNDDEEIYSKKIKILKLYL